MPERESRLCTRCIRAALPGSPYCEVHQPTVADADESGPRHAVDLLRPLYNSQRWRRRVAPRVLARDSQCRVLVDGITQCEQLSRHVHHIVDAEDYIRQHDGDTDAFFDEENLAGVCHDCHSRITIARQRGADYTEYAEPGGDTGFSPVF